MTVTSQTELKSLETQLTRSEAELRAARTQQNEVNQSVNMLGQRIAALKAKINQAKSTDIIVSEHAILRYLERVTGIPIEEVKAAILPDGIKKLAMTAGSGKYPVGTHKIVVRGNTVVTIETDRD